MNVVHLHVPLRHRQPHVHPTPAIAAMVNVFHQFVAAMAFPSAVCPRMAVSKNVKAVLAVPIIGLLRTVTFRPVLSVRLHRIPLVPVAEHVLHQLRL